MEELTSMRKEISLRNKNLVSDLSEDLRAKSKKLRNEMKTFSKILETEISYTTNNLSGNITKNNYSKLNDFEKHKYQNNYKKDNLKIKTLNDNKNSNKNTNENSNSKHFKKINNEIKNTNKKINFFKSSPDKKDNNLTEKISQLKKEKNFDKGKSHKFKFEQKQFKNEMNEFNNFYKNIRRKNLKGITTILFIHIYTNLSLYLLY